MNARAIGRLLLVLGALLLFEVQPSEVRADNKSEPILSSRGTWVGSGIGESLDGDVEHWVEASCWEGIGGHLSSTSMSNYNSWNGQHALKRPWYVSYSAPLSKWQAGDAARVYALDAQNHRFLLGYSGDACTYKATDAVRRLDAEANWTLGARINQSHMEGTCPAAHFMCPLVLIDYVGNFPNLNWQMIAPPLVAEFTRFGAPSMVMDESGHFYPEHDANGDLVWSEVPETAMRLTSEVEYLGGNSVKYTYTLENLTDEVMEFSIPDVRTSSLSSGWTGTAQPNETLSVEDTVGGSGSDLWMQQTQGAFRSHAIAAEASSEEWHFGSTELVYIPACRAAFTGVPTITSAEFDTQSGVTQVAFHVDMVASEAHLYRTFGGVTTMVASRTDPLDPMTTYVLEDSAPPAGTSTYWVVSGVRLNGVASESEEVVR